MFLGVYGLGSDRKAPLTNTLNSHPMALKHLMPALTHFYCGEGFFGENVTGGI